MVTADYFAAKVKKPVGGATEGARRATVVAPPTGKGQAKGEPDDVYMQTIYIVSNNNLIHFGHVISTTYGLSRLPIFQGLLWS